MPERLKETILLLMNKVSLIGSSVVALLLLQAGCQRHFQMERPISIELTVPDPAWQVEIEQVYEAEDRLLVVSRVQRDPDVMAAQVISRTSDLVRVRAPDLPVEHFVVGKTWGWTEESYHFVSEEEVGRVTANARLIFQSGFEPQL